MQREGSREGQTGRSGGWMRVVCLNKETGGGRE